jgi:anti-sigma B factor antagonist
MFVPLRIAEHTAGDVVVLTLTGHLVFDEGDRILRDRIADLMRDGRTAILIDLGGVTYMDSGGVGTLVQIYTQLTKRGGQLKLLHPSWCSSRVLQITHLTSVFEIFEDEAQALRSMTAGVG